MHNLRFQLIKGWLTAMEQTLSRFAIKLDEKDLESPERNRRASANMQNKIFVILYGGARLNMFLGTKSLIIIIITNTTVLTSREKSKSKIKALFYYSEMITEILCPDVLKAGQYCKQISGSAQKGTICR